MAGSRLQRVSDIVELLADTTIGALLASWGGKSANQLVRDLPYDEFLAARKPVIGFSDACVLLNAITAVTGLITFAGPNIAGKLIESSHWDLGLMRGNNEPPFGRTAEDCWHTIIPGHAQGQLFGGNLSTFVLGTVGTDVMALMHDIIFFWESASEPPQIIDQHLACLDNAGFLERVRAIIVGDVSYTEEARKERPLDDVIRDYALKYQIPAVQIPTFGHHMLENPAIPIGAVVELNTVDRTVSYTGPVVAVR